MATLYAWTNGGNWTTIGTWRTVSSAGASSGTIPGAGDDCIFDAGAVAAVTVVGTTTSLAKTVTCQSANNNIAFAVSTILIVSGSVTFFAGMTLSGTGTLKINAAATLTNGAGLTFPGAVNFAITGTVAVVNSWIITGVTTISNALVLNSANLAHTWTMNGGFTLAIAISGTTVLILGGSGGTWSGNFSVSNSMTVNCTDYIFSGTVQYKTGTFTYTAGAITFASTPILNISGNCTMASAALIWNTINLGATSIVTLTTNFDAINFTQTAYNMTFAGAFNVAITNFKCYATSAGPLSFTWAAGTTVSISTLIYISSAPDAGTVTLKSGTSPNYANLNYQGPVDNCKIFGAIFTDVDASTSIRPLYNWYGSALTHCVNVVNCTITDMLLSIAVAAVKVDTAAIIATLGTPANIDGGGATLADNLKKLADDNGGLTFDATTDSQNKIKAAVGTPVAFDGGAATLAGNLQKLADDNNGATFNAEFDSQNKIKAAITGLNNAPDVSGTMALATELAKVVNKLPTNYLAGAASVANLNNAPDLTSPLATVDGIVDDIKAAIGTPVALDIHGDIPGLATLASMLTKMVDDNGGADYNCTTSSLDKIPYALWDYVIPTIIESDKAGAILKHCLGIPDQVWGALLVTNDDSGSFGKAIALIKSQTDHLKFAAGADPQPIVADLTGVALTTDITALHNAPDLTTPLAAVKTVVDDIKLKTAKLSFAAGTGEQDLKATLDGETVKITGTKQQLDDLHDAPDLTTPVGLLAKTTELQPAAAAALTAFPVPKAADVQTSAQAGAAAALTAYPVPKDADVQADAAAALAAFPAAKPSDVAVTINVYETEDNS